MMNTLSNENDIEKTQQIVLNAFKLIGNFIREGFHTYTERVRKTRNSRYLNERAPVRR